MGFSENISLDFNVKNNCFKKLMIELYENYPEIKCFYYLELNLTDYIDLINK